MRRVILSPHLDDAVLSCGGSIAAQVASGDQVIVLTLFSAATGEARGRWAERADEDRHAASQLGFRAAHLGLPDAPFRDPCYTSFRTIVFGDAQPHAAWVDRCTRGLAAWLRSDGKPDELWAPLGVGAHIDHRLTFAAAQRIDLPLVLYEDRPYALCDQLVALRWHQLGALPIAPLPSPPPPASSSTHAFLDRLMPDADDRAYSLAQLDLARAALRAPERACAAWRVGAQTFARTVRALDARASQALSDGIRSYRSQLPALFGGDDDAAIAALYGDALHEEITWRPR